MAKSYKGSILALTVGGTIALMQQMFGASKSQTYVAYPQGDGTWLAFYKIGGKILAKKVFTLAHNMLPTYAATLISSSGCRARISITNGLLTGQVRMAKQEGSYWSVSEKVHEHDFLFPCTIETPTTPLVGFDTAAKLARNAGTKAEFLPMANLDPASKRTKKVLRRLGNGDEKKGRRFAEANLGLPAMSEVHHPARREYQRPVAAAPRAPFRRGPTQSDWDKLESI